ncbi:MAG: M67 family metallopeptidase [Candidatus Nitrohelix vancouverensis]|uniref:M67 family metallopeptidase n=1 Tax=Candidatus Nitrohelix vancouverensis TaxID=2705534 RepID=A0A7T0C0B6_9BACT|nr:MAG: M67 family metallopeptidase [Candidatus Nitrohelix vancouverensis]
MLLPFNSQLLDDVDRHAIEEYPNECCGIILGKPGDPQYDLFRPCENIQNKLHEKDPEQYPRDAKTAYNISPLELMKITNEARDKGLEFKTLYHSHPEHDAYFSEEDRRMALFDDEPVYPGVSYLVISVYNRIIKDRALFMWDASSKTFQKQTI